MSDLAETAGAGRKAGRDAIRTALIGLGVQGRALIGAMLRMGPEMGVRLQAVCDLWPWQLHDAERCLSRIRLTGHAAHPYTDWRQMLDAEGSLDAVIVATPDFCHAEQTVESLRRGLSVYCESPMSNSLADARRIVLAARGSQGRLQIGNQRRSNWQYRFCAEQLMAKANLLHRVTTVRSQWHRSRASWAPRGWPAGSEVSTQALAQHGYESMDELLNWRWRRRLGGGLFHESACHQLDVCSWFLGEALPRSVVACGNAGYWTQSEHPDSVAATFEFVTAGGIVRATHDTMTTNSNMGCYEHFMGDEATLMISQSPGYTAAYREGWVEAGNPNAAAQWQKWEHWVDVGIVLDVEGHHAPSAAGAAEALPEDGVADVRQSPRPPRYAVPAIMRYPAHLPHLRNFFMAFRGVESLRYPPDLAYRSLAMTLKARQAADAQRTLAFEPGEFVVENASA